MSKSNDNQIIRFGQLTEFNMRSTFQQKPCPKKSGQNIGRRIKAFKMK